MNNRIINIVVAIAAVFNTLMYAILLALGKEIPFWWPTTMETMIFTNVMRLVTVLAIIIIGRITLNIRNRSENAINHQINMIHGERAERLTLANFATQCQGHDGIEHLGVRIFNSGHYYQFVISPKH